MWSHFIGFPIHSLKRLLAILLKKNNCFRFVEASTFRGASWQYYNQSVSGIVAFVVEKFMVLVICFGYYTVIVGDSLLHLRAAMWSYVAHQCLYSKSSLHNGGPCVYAFRVCIYLA